MKLIVLFAQRYLLYKRSVSFITIITTLSVIGITVGVAALICVSAIFNGFGALYFDMMSTFDPHIRIIPQAKADVTLLKKDISNLEGIREVTIFHESKIIGSWKGATQPFIIRTVKTADSNDIRGLMRSNGWGKNTIGMYNSIPYILIGAGVCDKLKAVPGDTITILSLGSIDQAAMTMSAPQGIRAIIGGVFITNIKEYDATMIYAFEESVPSLQRYTYPYIDIRLDDKETVPQIMNILSKKNAGTVLTWRDLHSDIYGVVEFERMVSFIIVGLVVVVSAFNILASLSMTVVQKRRDIALLKALGASEKFIGNIYFTKGMIIGCSSTFLGAALGIGLCWGQQTFGWITLDGAVSIVPTLPVVINPSIVVFAIISSLILCLLATIYPARRAASMAIAENISEQ
ncbi:MAG TPA: FtsX-like permease family protein [Candidatus Kapabacteria bacterium]|nr:FtsX-like permease family protein [Candidatus Kapabacteria bacterium]